MASPEWRARRAAYFATHPQVCTRCDERKLIHLHHLTYVRMGSERDGDLLPLCTRCHRLVHTYHRLFPKITLARATRELVADRDLVLPARVVTRRRTVARRRKIA